MSAFQPDAFQPDAFQTDDYPSGPGYIRDNTTVTDSVAASGSYATETRFLSENPVDLQEGDLVTDSVAITSRRTATSTFYLDDNVTVELHPLAASVLYLDDNVELGPTTPHITAVGTESLVETERSLRATLVGAEVLAEPYPRAAATAVGAEALLELDPSYTPPEKRTAVDHAVGVSTETFSRTETGGFGTSEWGPDWVTALGSPTNFSVEGGRARIVISPNSAEVAVPLAVGRPLEILFSLRLGILDPELVNITGDFYFDFRDASGFVTARFGLSVAGFVLNSYLHSYSAYNTTTALSISGRVEDNANWSPNPATPHEYRLRFVDDGLDYRLRVWRASSPEPSSWHVIDRPQRGLAFGPNNYGNIAPSSGPVSFHVGTWGYQWDPPNFALEIDSIEFLAGLGPIEAIEHEIGITEQPGTLIDTTTLTESVARFIDRIRRPTDTLPILADHPHVPVDEELLPEGTTYLFDWFDRELLNQMGASTSGWPYPFFGQSAGTPEFAIADGMFILVPSETTGSRWIDVFTPTAPRLGLQFDLMWPPDEQAHGPFLYWDDGGRWADLYFWNNTLELRTPWPLTPNWVVYPETPEPGDWLRIRYVFPQTMGPGQSYGLKVWPRDEEEPDDWLAVGSVPPGGIVWEPYSPTSWPQFAGRGLLELGAGTAQRSALVITNLVLFDPISVSQPGALRDVYRTTDSIKATHWHHPDDFFADATDNVSTWVPDMIVHRVDGPPDQPIETETDTVLAEPATSGSTTIVVTPAPVPTDSMTYVEIDGVQYVVESTSGGTLTLATPLAKAYAAGTKVKVRVVPARITIDGVNITSSVIWSETSFSTFAGGQVGTCRIKIKDVERTRSITTGKEIVVHYRGIRVWGGYVKQVERAYAFTYGGGARPWPRFLNVSGVDYNILLDKRVLHNKQNPVDIKFEPPWPVGTADSTAVIHMTRNQLDLSGDGLRFNIKTTTSVAPFEPFAPAHAGFTWNQGMASIVDRTRAVYYIDPDKVFNYVDDSTAASRFGWTGLSDTPNNTTTLGYRDFELVYDGTKLVNDQMVWGAGQGSAEMAFHRERSQASINEHGLWQQGEFRQDMYKPESVQRRAETWVHGSAANRRGHKDDNRHVRCTVFEPYFRVGDVVQVHNASFGFTDLIPIRGAEITFPTPFDIQMRLTVSHEIDPPWNTYEWWMPKLNWDDWDEWEWPPWENPPPLDFLPGPETQCIVDWEDNWVPSSPPRNYQVVVPPLHAPSHSYTWTKGGRIGAGPPKNNGEPAWVWIESGGNPPNRMGYVAHDDVTTTPGIKNSLLYRLQKKWTGVVAYTFGSMWPIGGGDGARIETRAYHRLAVEIPGYTGMILVTIGLDYRVEGWNSWHKYWLGGFTSSFSMPLDAEDPSFEDDSKHGDWPDPFHIEGAENWPEKWDMTSDMLNGEGVYSQTENRSTWQGKHTFTRLMWSGDAILQSFTYSGKEPHDATPPDSANWTEAGGTVQVHGRYAILDVREASNAVVIRRKTYDDGTECIDTPIWGEVNVPLQQTNDPGGLTYRFPGGYAPGSTRVFVDGTLVRVNVIYEETDPQAGLITFFAQPGGQVTAVYWGTGLSHVNTQGMNLILPAAGPITAHFGPHSSLWPPRDWHGTYYPHFHNGTDFGVVVGTPVYAAAAGTVRWETQSAGGIMIHIHHKPGVSTVYAHLNSRIAAHGSFVEAGAIIGTSGQSGYVTGPHLHWGLVINGVPEDPMGLVT